jgi:cytochrome c oxidase subunit 2
VKLSMISQDLIHSLYVPGFRIKNDVLPGRYSHCWFEASKPGEFHLFCAEYCGTNHSRMTGSVIVMPPAEFEEWLAGGSGETPIEAGRRLFGELGCKNCHRSADGPARCPGLEGIFGRSTRLKDSSTVTADETYLRESILRPGAKVVVGFEPIMPSFDGQLQEEQLIELIAYLKSLGAP